MNSLEELNYFSQGLIEFGDLRGPGLDWDRDPADAQSLTILEGQDHAVPVGAELLSIRNYQALNVYYQIDLTNLAGSSVTWPTLPVYITENPQVGQVYRVSGLSNTDDWALLKTTQITLPQDYSGTFTYTVTVGTILGVERSWTVTVTVLEVTLWEIGTFSRFMPLQHYYYDGSQLKVRQTETTPFKMRHANIVDAGNVPGVTYTVTISFNFPEIINAISTTYNGVNHNYTGNVSVNSTTKTITLSGSKQNINQTLGIYDPVQLATNPNYIPTYPGFNITYNVIPTKMDLIATYTAVSSLGEEDTVKIHYITQPGPSVLVKDSSYLRNPTDKKDIFAGSYQTYTPNTPKTINSSYYIIPSNQSLPPLSGNDFRDYQDVFDLEIYAQPTTAISNITATASSSYNLYSQLNSFGSNLIQSARTYGSTINPNGNSEWVNPFLRQPAMKKISVSSTGEYIVVANSVNLLKIWKLNVFGTAYELQQTIEIGRFFGVTELPLFQVVMNGAGDRLVFNIKWSNNQQDATMTKEWMNSRIYTYNRSGVTWTQSGFFEYTPGTLSEIEPFVSNNTNNKWMRFGHSMAISDDGNYLAVTVLYYPNWGTGTDGTRDEFSQDFALIYVYNAGVWQFQQKITLTGAYGAVSSGTYYGGAHCVNLDADGNTLVCSGKDMAHVFVRAGSTWTKQTTIVGPQKTDRLANSTTSIFPFQSSQSRNIVTVTSRGLMKIQTTKKKFGSGATQNYPGAALSMASLYVLNNDNFKFESNDFTIEMWISSAGQNNKDSIIFDFRKRLLNNTALRAGRLYAKYIQSGLYWITYAVNDQNTDTFSDKINTQFTLNTNTNTFKHLAVSRVSGITRIFIDGIQRGPSYADNNNYTSNSIIFANSSASLFDVDPRPMGGVLDEIRISRTGRYYTNFTVPNTAFVNDADTRLLLHCDGADQSTEFVDDNTAVGGANNNNYKQVQSISVSDNIITFNANHNLTTGDRLVYNTDLGVSAITGLTLGQAYFVRVVQSNRVTLHNTKANAVANANIVDISGVLPTTGTGLGPFHYFGNYEFLSPDCWGSQCEISNDGDRVVIVAAGKQNMWTNNIQNGYLKIYDRSSGTWTLTQTLNLNNYDVNISLSGDKNYLTVVNAGFELNGIGYSQNLLSVYRLNSSNQYALQQQQQFSNTYLVKPYVVKLTNDSNNIIAMGDLEGNVYLPYSGSTNSIPGFDYYRASLVYGYDSSTRKFKARGSSAAIGQMLNAITITPATGQTADYYLLYSANNTYYVNSLGEIYLSAIGSEYWDNTGN
jgi:hypothetical protein